MRRRQSKVCQSTHDCILIWEKWSIISILVQKPVNLQSGTYILSRPIDQSKRNNPYVAQTNGVHPILRWLSDQIDSDGTCNFFSTFVYEWCITEPMCRHTKTLVHAARCPFSDIVSVRILCTIMLILLIRLQWAATRKLLHVARWASVPCLPNYPVPIQGLGSEWPGLRSTSSPVTWYVYIAAIGPLLLFWHMSICPYVHVMYFFTLIRHTEPKTIHRVNIPRKVLCTTRISDTQQVIDVSMNLLNSNFASRHHGLLLSYVYV